METQSAAPQQKENIMGTMNIWPLLMKLSLPMMLSMLIQALYNIVDSIFVSRVSEAALTGVSLAFSLQTVMIAVGVGTGVGVNACLSKALGEKNQKLANRLAVNGLFLAAVSCVVFMLIGVFGVRFYFAAQTDDPVILQHGVDYMTVCCLFSQGLFASTMLEKLLTATGRPKYAMISQMTGAVLNMILDPIFIFGYMGEYLSGTRGAAVATVIGQFSGAFIGIAANLLKNKDISLSFRGFRPDMKAIGRIYSVGLPSIAMQCVGSVMVFLVNRILMGFTSTAVAVFGVYFKLQSFAFMPVFGLNNGMVPIIGYNYGARKPDRVVKTIRCSCVVALTIMVAAFLTFQLIPDVLLGMFDASDSMLAIGVPALRIISVSFPVAAFSVIFGSVFQALGEGLLSLYVSFGRQIVVLVPVAWLLSRTGNLQMVWLAWPIAEVMAIALCIVFMVRCWRKIIKPMREIPVED